MARKTKFDKSVMGKNIGGVITDKIDKGSVKSGPRRTVVKTTKGVATMNHNNQTTGYTGTKTKTVYKDGELKRKKEVDFTYDNGAMVKRTIKKYKNAL